MDSVRRMRLNSSKKRCSCLSAQPWDVLGVLYHVGSMDHRDASILVLLADPGLDHVLQDFGRSLGVVDVLLGLFELLL